VSEIDRIACALLLTVGACGGSEVSSTSATGETQSAPDDLVREGPSPSPQSGDETEEATPGPRGDVLEGRIVDRGPLGHGSCIQQSYEIERTGGERLWIHFERCGSDYRGPLFDALETGKRYRFRVERGASPNFGDDPMIVGADPLPD
jgi:hypothetical protein